MKSKGLPPGLPYPAKLSFRIEGQINSFPDKKKLKFIIIKLVLCEILKVFFKENKNMNKMAINTYLSTAGSKNQHKQAEHKQKHRYREYFDGCQMGGVLRGW